MMIQKNKIIAIYLFIYIFLYIVCVSLEQYMQQPLNGVTSYRAAKLWGRGNKLQAGGVGGPTEAGLEEHPLLETSWERIGGI